MSIPLLKSGLPQDQTAATMGLLGGHDLIFLGLSMAAGKPIADPARDIPFCTGVTAMARNGTEFGIQVSGLEGEWFTALRRKSLACTCQGTSKAAKEGILGTQPSPRRSVGVGSCLGERRGSQFRRGNA